MALTNKETKAQDSPVKTPTKRARKAPTKTSPKKTGSSLATDGNVQLLWACLKRSLGDGQTVSLPFSIFDYRSIQYVDLDITD